MASAATLNPTASRGASGRGPLSEATNSHYMASSESRGGGAIAAAKRSISGASSRRRLVSTSHAAGGPDDAGDASGEERGGWGLAPRRPTAGPRRSLTSRMVSGASRGSARPDVSSGSSSHLSGTGSGPPSRTASSSYTNRSGLSTLARANARRISMAPGGGLAGEASVVPAKKLAVDSTSFEEWMKMATDNKINSTNTFSIALIDYFHDMSLLRSDSGDGSINFQKASCTLDGCVKVWTSRVDSVVNETGKLLNGLVGDGKGVDDDADLDADIELDEDGNQIGGKGGKNKKKRARAKEATLVKNFSAIAVKKLDLEYTVDPLFKKTSADFDEGGAGGLLMNHLGVDDKMRVVFDAGEAPGLPEASDQAEVGNAAEDLERIEAGLSGEITPIAEDSTPSDQIDLSRLQAKLFSLAPPSLLTDSSDPIGALLGGRLICPSLSRFSFAGDQEDRLFGQEDGNDSIDDADEPYMRATTPVDLGPMNPAIAATPWGGQDDPYDGGNYGYDQDESGIDLFGVPTDNDRDGDVFGVPADAPGGSIFNEGLSHGFPAGGSQDFRDDGDLAGEGHESALRWDARQGPSQHELLLAFNGVAGNDDDGRDGAEANQQIGGLFDYFDRKLMKSWAGPEHWRMRGRLAGLGSQGPNPNKAADDSGAQSQSKKKRPSKEAFTIDFVNSEAPATKEIFEQPKTVSSITMPKSKAHTGAHLLPEDRHFSSRRLLRLFSKPRAVLNIRTKKGAVRFGAHSGAPGFGAAASQGGDIDVAFWAQQQTMADASGDGAFGGQQEPFDNDNPMPLDTQFYHDGDDDGAFELASAIPQTQGTANGDVDMADFEEDELVAHAAALKRVKPEFVNYAKKAKRVDIRKLKENIWKELGIEGVIEDEGDAEQTQSADSTVPASQSPKRPSQTDEPKIFRNVLSGLRKVYPKEKMEEISTSFCFICLLHLANEEGLEIKVGDRAGLSLNSHRGQEVLRRLNGPLTMPSRIVEEDEEDDDESDTDNEELEDEDVDAFGRPVRVGRLEYLKIEKDPNAGRSA
ncbi:unnamed protein product [Parajaminaea phylloscopi]